MEKMSIKDFSKIPLSNILEELRGITRSLKIVCVEWPEPLECSSLLVVAPKGKALHYGGLPQAKFVDSLYLWQEEKFATLLNYKLVRDAIKVADPVSLESFSFLGIPEIYATNGKEKIFAFHENVESQKINCRVHGYLCSNKHRPGLAKSLLAFSKQLGAFYCFDANDASDLHRQYVADGDEMLLIDDRISKASGNSEAQRGQMLKLRRDALRSALDGDNVDDMSSFHFRPWIYASGYSDLIPRAPAFGGGVFSGVLSLNWEVLSMRAELIRRWKNPIFYKVANDALAQHEGGVSFFQSSFKKRFLSDLTMYVVGVRKSFDVFSLDL